MVRILLLEDSALDAELIVATLREGGIEFEPTVVQTREDFERHVDGQAFALILADYALPDFDGISALEIARTRAPHVPFIFISSCMGEELAVETLKRGATDYVLKQRLSRLLPCVQRALHEAEGRRQRKHLESVLANNERIAELGRLAATIAHEINNPMAAVRNLLYLIDTHPKLDDSLKAFVQMAQQEMGRMAEIAHQTLSFYRESPTRVPVNISELVQGVVWLYDRQIKEKQIMVEKQFDADVICEVLPGEIRQAISNLVSNSVQACPHAGRLIVRVHQAHEWSMNRDGVRILIADDGDGIPVTDRSKIFEPFFSTKGEDGTGLGLWVTKGIVERHQGRLRFRSSTVDGRRGTSFSLFLPSRAPENPVLDSAITEKNFSASNVAI